MSFNVPNATFRGDGSAQRINAVFHRRALDGGLLPAAAQPLAADLSNTALWRMERLRPHYRPPANYAQQRNAARRRELAPQNSQTNAYDWTGADAAPWNPQWTFTQGSGDVLTNRGRMVTTTGAFDACSAYIDLIWSDITVAVDVELPSVAAQFPEIRFRFDNGNFDYIRVLLEPHNNVWTVHDYDNDIQQTLLANGAFTFANNDVVHIELQGVGNAMALRLWKNAETRPADATAQFSSAFGATNTKLMVRTVTSNLAAATTNYWDNLTFSQLTVIDPGSPLSPESYQHARWLHQRRRPSFPAAPHNNQYRSANHHFRVPLPVPEEAPPLIPNGHSQTRDSMTRRRPLHPSWPHNTQHRAARDHFRAYQIIDESVTGTIGVTDANDTSAIAGIEEMSGTIGVTDTNDTSSATATQTFSGTIGVTDANDTSSFAGDVINGSGTMAVTDANDTSAFTGTVVAPSVTGTIAVTDANDTSAITAGQSIPGTVARTDANDTSAFTGTVVYNPVGTIGITDANDTVSLTGTTFPNPTGTIARTDATDTLSFSGIVANPVTGTMTIVEQPDRTSISAQRYGRQPVETREAGPVFPAGRRRRYYNASRNPVTGPG